MTADVREPGAALLEALERIAGDAPRTSDSMPFALGWATVELDRAAGAFAETFGPSATPAVAAPDDTLLGASCRIVALDLPGLPYVVLLEPYTEGRLAATLARRGEGPIAVWLGAVAPGAPTAMAASTLPIGTGGHGPFGPQILLPGSPTTGPHRLLVPAEPGTITP
jgi:hypothetical protein